MKKELLHNLFNQVTNGGFHVTYWDGDERKYGNDESDARIIFNKPLPTNMSITDPILAFGEAYMDGIVDFEGNMEDIFSIVEQNKGSLSENNLRGKMSGVIRDLGKAINKNLQKDNIQYHYDLGNDFFRLWLDDTMNYSCGYFKTPEDSLEQAQMQKIEHTLKKLQLKPGERILDIGSGWGWLILHAAKQYNVAAVGVTLSQEQVDATKDRIKAEGLEGQVEVRLQDYLDLDENQEQFDKILSIGMFEHVGKENLPKYMDKVNKLLKDGGLSMLHTIAGVQEKGVNSWILKYIFPGGYIPSLRETIWLLPDYDFHLLHTESLRMHYAMTLDHWHANFLKHTDHIEEMFDERFVRMWDLYLRGCAASFRTTGLNIYQILFSKKLNNNLALTLDHIYS